MENERIDLRRERDFGEIFNSSLTFLKQEIRSFGKGILVLVLPAMVLLTLFSSYQSTTQIMYDPFLKNIIIVFLAILTQTIIYVTIYAYLNLYFLKYQKITIKELFIEFRYNFFRIFWALIIIIVIIALSVGICIAVFSNSAPIIGVIFAIIAAIYFLVSFSMMPSIMVFEDRGVGYAFSRSFKLTHMKWWNTFLILLVGGIIVFVIAVIIQSPLYILLASARLHNNFDLFNNFNGFIIVYSSIASSIIKIFYIIPAFLAAFQYFSLVEAREKPSLIARIDEIGENE